MPQYVLLLDAHAMDDFRAEDMPDIDRAAHAVSQEAMDAGVWICGSGLAAQRASVVSADGTVTDGPQVTVGGLTVIEVPSREQALQWAAKWSAACRCDQQIWELAADPQIDAMQREAALRKSSPDNTWRHSSRLRRRRRRNSDLSSIRMKTDSTQPCHRLASHRGPWGRSDSPS